MGVEGFLKEAVDPVLTSGVVGAAIGAFLGRKSSPMRGIGSAIIGASTGSALAAGIRGAIRTPDLSGLTPSELAVVRAEADKMVSERGKQRFGEVASGIGAAMMSGNPSVLVATLPRATIAPYDSEVESIERMADRFRAARRGE